MDLKSYMGSLSIEERAEFVERLGTSLGYLRHVAYGVHQAGAEFAVKIEKMSGKAVKREELRPDLFL